MFRAATIARVLSDVFVAHDRAAKKPHKRIRFLDGKTPYGVHPAWCALSILAEPRLSEEIRVLGFWVLACHDLLEDTTAALPSGCPPRARVLVREMTFRGIREEMERVWKRNKITRLFKLFDKCFNLMDGLWMPPENHVRYVEYTLRLAGDVERNYGELNIVAMARAVCALPYEFRESPWNTHRRSRKARQEPRSATGTLGHR